MPSVSVVIPAYNRERTILRAVRSIMEQTLSPAEVILVDDASTDETVSVLGQACSAVRVIRMPHRSGAQAARAAGIRAATGDWVAFLDSDDWWLPQKLEWQLAKAAEGFPVVHGPGLIRRNGNDEPFAVPPLEGNIYAHLLKKPAPLYQCLLVRRECFEKAGYPDPAIAAYQEWDMSLLLARHYSFGYVDKPLFVYEIQGDSISKDGYRGLRGYEQIVTKWWKEIRREAGTETGFAHYRTLAWQAYTLTGWPGYLHYLRLGANLAGKSFPATLAAEARYSGPSHCKHVLAQKAPWLRAFYRRILGRGDRSDG